MDLYLESRSTAWLERGPMEKAEPLELRGQFERPMRARPAEVRGVALCVLFDRLRVSHAEGRPHTEGVRKHGRRIHAGSRRRRRGVFPNPRGDVWDGCAALGVDKFQSAAIVVKDREPARLIL